MASSPPTTPSAKNARTKKTTSGITTLHNTIFILYILEYEWTIYSTLFKFFNHLAFYKYDTEISGTLETLKLQYEKTLEARTTELKNQRDTVQKELEVLTGHASKLEKDNGDLQTVIQTSNSMIAELEAQLRNVRQTNVDQSTALEEATTKYATSSKSIDEMEATLKDERNKILELNIEISKLHQSHGDQQNLFNEVSSKHAVTSKQAEDFEAALNIERARVKELLQFESELAHMKEVMLLKEEEIATSRSNADQQHAEELQRVHAQNEVQLQSKLDTYLVQ